jgi:thiamine kinase-like enzyme
MPFALPRTVQHKLDQTLAQWPHWQCAPALECAPEVVRILSPGVSNHSILVESGQRFVVRIDGLNPAANGLNRQVEWRTLQSAHDAGLAPSPHYFNPDLGSLVCGFLPPDVDQAADAAEVGRLLRAIHALPARHHRLDIAERILRHEKKLQHRGVATGRALRECRGPVSELLDEINRQGADSVLCHNDLLHANRLYSGGRLWALDWEYCAMASPWYDIAVVVHGDALSDAQADTLLHAYLGRAPADQERQQLYRYGCIYRYLELIWYLALEKPVLTQDEVEARTSALVNLLARRDG